MNSTLPDYKQMMSPEVRDRLARLVRRPVIMETRNLFKEFPTSSGKNQIVLKDISFQVHQREFLSIIGPSGCGKSTLIRILAGLETATSGEILLDGKPVVAPGAERGMVFQKYTLFPWLTVCRNVMFGLESIGKDRDTAENIALQWLDIIGLARYADYYPGQLSGGMQQRVAIARALAPQPRVLLMDEPFGALDAQTRTQMQNYLLEVWRNIDITIIFVTHDLDEAVYLSDRILALKANPGEINEYQVEVMSVCHTFKAGHRICVEISCLDLPDVVSFNMYSGWYQDVEVKERHEQEMDWIASAGGAGKPVIVSEFGAAAMYGYRDRGRCKWSEERQADVIRENLEVYQKDSRLSGAFIWQFADCRVTEEGGWFATRARSHNNKGVLDEYRRPKLAYDTVKEFFENWD